MSSNNRNAAYLEDARTNATGERFSELDITLTIQRKPAYYIYVLIVPTFVISLINTIGLFSAKREREDKWSGPSLINLEDAGSNPPRAIPHPTKVLIPLWVGELVAASLRCGGVHTTLTTSR
uniref:Uncharacterized protein n=1 Tax=Plectus sambesii TaxID=2011161 RepID=A0A914UIT4_9BILA